jgi:pimeloyl-ACP methyl ester carboxylesterase
MDYLLSWPESASRAVGAMAVGSFLPSRGPAAASALAISGPGATALPLLVAVGGAAGPGDAHALWRALEPAARAAGIALLVPLFETARGQTPALTRPDAQPADDAAVCSAIADASRLSGCRWSRWFLLGHAQGAALAHRLARAAHGRVAALALSSAPWYPWPADALAASAGRRPLPVGIWVGAQDRVPLPPEAAPGLPAGDAAAEAAPSAPPVCAGLHRVERARRWVQAVRDAARLEEQPCDVSLSLLPCADADIEACAQAGLVEEVIGFFNASTRQQQAARGTVAP